MKITRQPREGLTPHVYFVQALNDEGLVKVGVAADLTRRLQHLRAMSPVGLILRARVPGGYASESAVHRLLTSNRHHGEWFTPDGHLPSLIETANMLDRLLDHGGAESAFLHVIERLSTGGVYNLATLVENRGGPVENDWCLDDTVSSQLVSIHSAPQASAQAHTVVDLQELA